MRPRLLDCALIATLAAAGCDDKPRPWEGKEGPPVVLSAAPQRAADGGGGGDEAGGDGAGGGDGADEAAAGGDAGGQGEPGEAAPVRVGGPWVRCYGNFRLSGEPLKDMTRLSLLCGPSNGMRRLSRSAIEGAVGEGQPTTSERLQLIQGACYRIFAVADRGVADLDVAVRSSRGAVIASDGGEDGWPIVQPDRPFCALEDDEATVEVSARKGSGRFAAEVWVLRPKVLR